VWTNCIRCRYEEACGGVLRKSSSLDADWPQLFSALTEKQPQQIRNQNRSFMGFGIFNCDSDLISFSSITVEIHWGWEQVPKTQKFRSSEVPSIAAICLGSDSLGFHYWIISSSLTNNRPTIIWKHRHRGQRQDRQGVGTGIFQVRHDPALLSIHVNGRLFRR
jgi:hypothetical protein